MLMMVLMVVNKQEIRVGTMECAGALARGREHACWRDRCDQPRGGGEYCLGSVESKIQVDE